MKNVNLPFRIRDLQDFFAWLEKNYGFESQKDINSNGWNLFCQKSKQSFFVGTTPSGARATCGDLKIHNFARKFNFCKKSLKRKTQVRFLENRILELEEKLAAAQERIEILS